MCATTSIKGGAVVGAVAGAPVGAAGGAMAGGFVGTIAGALTLHSAPSSAIALPMIFSGVGAAGGAVSAALLGAAVLATIAVTGYLSAMCIKLAGGIAVQGAHKLLEGAGEHVQRLRRRSQSPSVSQRGSNDT